MRWMILVLALVGATALGNELIPFTYSPENQPLSGFIILRDSISPADTSPVKYQGYRLQFTEFELLKKIDDWVKIRFTVVNSGRFDVDFRKKGREHWVQFIFDQSLFDAKLGGLREHIKHELVKEEFFLEVGKTVLKKELKVSTMPPPAPPDSEPVLNGEPIVNEEPVVFTPKGGGDEIVFEIEKPKVAVKDECPDIYFAKLAILEQDDKWATIEYTVSNKGNGRFILFGENNGRQQHLAIRAYISGVEVMSRGALPIGGQFVKEIPGQIGILQPGESHTGKVKLDIRKKTRYMKSLILSLESDQFIDECDKTNNTGAVVLD